MQMQGGSTAADEPVDVQYSTVQYTSKQGKASLLRMSTSQSLLLVRPPIWSVDKSTENNEGKHVRARKQERR